MQPRSDGKMLGTMDTAAPGADTTSDAPRARWTAVAVAVVLLAELALVWAHPRLPTNDGPAHQYSAWVAHRLRVDPQGALARWFELNPRRIYPNAGYSWFLESLADRLPMPAAEKLGASLFLIALPIAAALLARAAGRRWELPALVAAGLAPGFPFFMGFFNFLWGVPLALLLWAHLLRCLERPTPVRLLLANALLAATFCAHLVAFAVAVGGGLVLIAAAWRRRPWRALLGLAPVAALAPWFWPRTVGPGARIEWLENPLERLVETLGLGVATSQGGAERVGAALFGLLLCALLVASWRRSEPRVRALLWLVAALFVLSLASPSAVGSGSFLGERVMLFFWLAAAATLEVSSARWRATAVGLLTLGALVHVGFLEGHLRAFDRNMDEFLEGAKAVPRGADLFGFCYTGAHHDLVSAPMATVDTYVHLELGLPDFRLYQAVPPDAPYFPIHYTRAGKARFPREALHDHLALYRIARWADALLLWHAPPGEVARILARGDYRQTFERGRVRVFLRQPGPPEAAGGPDPTRR